MYVSFCTAEERSEIVKTPEKHGKPWTPQDVQKMRDLASGNTPTRLMAMKLGRTPDAVRGKASDEGVSLKPTNQSPYNRRKK